MPHTSSQAFLRELFLRSGDIPVADGVWAMTGISPLPNLAALAQPASDAGLIAFMATIPFHHADLEISKAELRMWN